MRHRLRPRPLWFGSLAALSVLAGPWMPARAEDGAPGATAPESSTREFPEHNFKWTVPAKWTFGEPAEADKSAGFVVTATRVVSPGVEVRGYALVRDAGGASVESNLQQVRDNKSRKLTDIDAKIESVGWSGAEQAHVLKILGKAENKGVVSSRVYAGIVSGKYHQLDLRSVNGAHHEVEGEIAEAAKGYQFLTGAKADEEPAPGAEPAAENPLQRRFEKLGLTWTLPKPPEPTEPPPGSESKEPSTYAVGFTSEGNKDIAPLESGLCSVGVLNKDGGAAIVVVLELPKAKADVSSLEVIKNEGNFDGAKERFEGSPVPAMDGETHLGNALASSRTMSGKDKEGRPLWIRWYATTIKKQLYLARVEAHDRAETTQKDWMKGALDGIRWDDTTSGVRGPYVTPFSSASEKRGTDWIDFEKKMPFKHSTVGLTKPATFGRLKYVATDDAFKPWVFAGEAREPGGLLFVGILRFDAKAFQQQKKEPETLIDDFENDWKNAIDEPKTRPKSEKQNKRPDTFRTGKGAGYDFSGVKEGNPIVEHGWVVKAGQNVFWVRAQFVGKEAETLLKDDWEALMKTIKFE